MMVIFEVFLAPDADPAAILSPDMKRDTQAQVMTLEDARKVGFAGLPDPPPGKEVRLIAVAQRDARWIQRTLETSELVGSFKVHEVD